MLRTRYRPLIVSARRAAEDQPIRSIEDQIDRHTFLAPTKHPAIDMFRVVFGAQSLEPSERIVAINSQQSDIRMMVQLSEFTLHGIPMPLEELPNNEKFLMQFIIPKAAKPGLKGILDAFGIMESTLFPDLEHLAADLRGTRYKP